MAFRISKGCDSAGTVAGSAIASNVAVQERQNVMKKAGRMGERGECLKCRFLPRWQPVPQVRRHFS